ncbi:MAG TPA: hypothetical protein VFI31_26120, partial [Pirellulales bacterium]|nr:hypothetical protein [Pirellulales bacterium]
RVSSVFHPWRALTALKKPYLVKIHMGFYLCRLISVALQIGTALPAEPNLDKSMGAGDRMTQF